MGAVGMAKPLSKPRTSKMIAQGNEYYRKGELGPAMQAYNSAIKADPENPIAWNNKGLILTIVGKYKEALACHMKALELDGVYIDAISNIGMIYAKMKKFEDAMEYYDAALELHPEHEAAWNNKGNLLAKMDRHEESLECYKKALEIDPNYVAAMNNMSVSLTHMKRFGKAIQLIDMALKERPTFAEAWYIKGKALIGQKDFEKAIICFERAHRLNPDFHKAEKALNILRTRLSEDSTPLRKKKKRKPRPEELEEKIEADLQELSTEMEHIESEYDHLSEHLNDSELKLFEIIGDDPSSRSDIKKALKHVLSESAMDRGFKTLEEKGLVNKEKRGRYVYYSRSETLGAMDEEIVELDESKVGKKKKKKLAEPKDFTSMVNEAKRMSKKGRHDEALKWYKKALKLNPYDEITLCLKAQVHVEMGSMDKAVSTVSEVLRSRPNSLPAWFTLANGAFQLEQWKALFQLKIKVYFFMGTSKKISCLKYNIIELIRTLLQLRHPSERRKLTDQSFKCTNLL